MRLPEGFVVISEAAPVTPFERRVHRVVKRIPAGTVASYGRIAEWAGRPGAARAVGGIMSRSGGALPAHRVVNASGGLVPGWEREQRERLRAEGVRLRAGRVADPIPWWPGPRTRPARSSA
jgi:methylated-DNA-protein-cysteine methyltransferase related protein